MNLLIRMLIFVPVMYLIMIVYAGQKETDARGVLRIAGRKTIKALVWTVILVCCMELLESVFLP